MDFDPSECIIRRELTANGKSRAFINDTPTTISALKKLGNRLIDIHSQHQNLLLGQENFQLSVLDTVASIPELILSYSNAFHKWNLAVKALDKAQNNLDESKKDEDYLRFLVTELVNFNPQPGEDETLQQQCDMLEHAQDIKSALMQGYCQLSEGDSPVTDTLRQVRNLIASIQSYFQQAEELTERLESCRIELQDIADTLESEGESIDYDPMRLEELQNRLNTLYSLEQKHHVGSSEELIDIMKQMKERLEMMDNSDEYIKQLQREEQEARTLLDSLSGKLTEKRTIAAKKVEKDVISCLKTLACQMYAFKYPYHPQNPQRPKVWTRYHSSSLPTSVRTCKTYLRWQVVVKRHESCSHLNPYYLASCLYLQLSLTR